MVTEVFADSSKPVRPDMVADGLVALSALRKVDGGLPPSGMLLDAFSRNAGDVGPTQIVINGGQAVTVSQTAGTIDQAVADALSGGVSRRGYAQSPSFKGVVH